jgi:hypothetical protein
MSLKAAVRRFVEQAQEGEWELEGCGFEASRLERDGWLKPEQRGRAERTRRAQSSRWEDRAERSGSCDGDG